MVSCEYQESVQCLWVKIKSLILLIYIASAKSLRIVINKILPSSNFYLKKISTGMFSELLFSKHLRMMTCFHFLTVYEISVFHKFNSYYVKSIMHL